MATDVNSNAPNPNPGVGPPQNDKPDSSKGAHDRAKDDKKQANPKPMDPNNPTVASTDGSKPILDAIKQVDPGNISGFIKKALDAMMMIRSIDGASGGGGGGGGGGSSGGTVAAAMGKGMLDASKLLAAAQSLGLKRILDALNAIMPTLIPLLDDEDINVLMQAIQAIITNTNVGVLSPIALQTSQATAAAIASVNSIDSASTTEDIVDATLTVASIGGSTLNIDVNSLAYMLMTAAVGTTIIETLQLNGAVVVTTVRLDSSYIQDQLANIPSFTGTEQQDIATDESATIANQLVTLITQNALTAAAFLDILRNTQANVQNKSLQNVLGTDLNGIMSQLMQLISQFAGNIQDSEQDHQPRGRLETVTEALQKHSKILGLIKKKLDVSDIFQSMGGLQGQAMSQIQSMMGSIASAAGSGSGIGQALQTSDIVASTSTIQSTLANILQSAQSPLQSLTSSALNSLVMNGSAMLNTLSAGQVQSMLAALPPCLAMSLMGTGTAMFSNMTSQEISTLLDALPIHTVNLLLAGDTSMINFNSSGASQAEMTSDIAAALSSVISTQATGTILMAILPNGTTVTCTVISANSADKGGTVV
jgi:hypothetical protein